MKPKFYKVQEYKVKIETGTPVELIVNIYHENKVELTEYEIIEEVNGYLQDIGIHYDTGSFFEIIEVRIEE